MSRLASLRQDLQAIRRFARRLEIERARGPCCPTLPPARLVTVPGLGEVFIRQADGPPGGPKIVLLHRQPLRWRSRLRKRVIWNSIVAVEYGLRLGAPEAA